MDTQRSDLRKELRNRRRALSADQQAEASVGLYDSIKNLQILNDSQHIALYLAMDGEIEPVVIQQHLWQMGKQCYLPVINKACSHEMLFVPYHEDTVLVANRYGIPEPVMNLSESITPDQLDLVFLPLTGFDLLGGRLGMGGGFYDRAFSHQLNAEQDTVLIGLAHECQKVDKIPMEDWDVPLSGVATSHTFYSFN